MPRFNCAVCGTEFKSRSTKRKCCSTRCGHTFAGRNKRKPLQERFHTHVQKADGDACWLWTSWVNSSNGYGQIRKGDGTRTDLLAHRVAWELANGSIPNGMMVCHKCDVRLCVRPDHLFLGTAADNQADMAAKGRACRGERHHFSSFTPAQVLDVRARYAGGESMRQLAKSFGVAKYSIFQIVHRLSWKHVT